MLVKNDFKNQEIDIIKNLFFCYEAKKSQGMKSLIFLRISFYDTKVTIIKISF